MQTAANHRQVQETKGTRLSERKGGSREEQFQKTVFWRRARVQSFGGFLLAELSLGKEKIFLFPAWGHKVVYNDMHRRTFPSWLPKSVVNETFLYLFSHCLRNSNDNLSPQRQPLR